MDDLISKASVCEILADIYPTDGEKVVAVKEIDKAYETILNLPYAERRGRWVKDEFGSRCGACGLYAYRDKFDKPWESPYCPNCGARMDGAEE